MNAAKTLLTSLLQAAVDVCFSKPGTSGMLFSRHSQTPGTAVCDEHYRATPC